jgi:hypothetical protein
MRLTGEDDWRAYWCRSFLLGAEACGPTLDDGKLFFLVALELSIEWVHWLGPLRAQAPVVSLSPRW